MSDTELQTARRWERADEQARAVLAAAPPRPASISIVLAITVVVLAVQVASAVVFAPGSTGRFVMLVVGALAGFGVVITDAVRARRAGRRGTVPVTRSLSRRERHAVDRAVRRRVLAPDDRLSVVRAAAVQTASGRALPAVVGNVVLFTALATSGVAFWYLYLSCAIVAVVALVIATSDVFVARRYLAGDPVRPRSGPMPDRNPGTRSGRSAAS